MKGAFALLVAFLEAPGRPLSREHRWPATRMREHIFSRSIDVQVLRLRGKLEPDPIAPRGGRRILLADEGVGIGPRGPRHTAYASLKLPRAGHWLS
jgi:two-component system OmpR family response regulator